MSPVPSGLKPTAKFKRRYAAKTCVNTNGFHHRLISGVPPGQKIGNIFFLKSIAAAGRDLPHLFLELHQVGTGRATTTGNHWRLTGPIVSSSHLLMTGT